MSPHKGDEPAHEKRWATHTDPCDPMMPGRAAQQIEPPEPAEPPRLPSGWWIVPAALLSGAMIGALVWATTARAHEAPSGWSYDASCCNAIQRHADGSVTGDCAPIPHRAVTEVRGGYVVRLAPGDHPLVTAPLERVFNHVGGPHPAARESGDQDFHACVYPADTIRCLYSPRGMF